MSKRIVSLVLAVLLMFSMAGISLAEEMASWLTDTSPVTLKVYYDRPINGAQVAEAWGNDPVSQEWMKDTNVNVEWSYAIDDSHSKLNMQIASGEYPDVLICQLSYDMLKDLAANDVIIKYNELQDTYAPGFVDRNMSANTVLYIRQFFDTMDVYALPVYSYKVEDMENPELTRCSTGIMVLKSVYEAIGSPDMTTIDGFLNALRKVKEMYPDLIPAQASRNSSTDDDGNPRCISKLFGMFDLTGGYYYDEANDTYKKYWNSDNYKELLKFVNTLYNEGLMDPTELTDSGEQLQAKLFNGQVFCNMNNDAENIDWFNTELKNAGVDDEWIFVGQPSINTEKGYTYDNIMGGVGDHCIVIFNTENAGRALQWVDYLMQDKAQREVILGVEGVSWEFNEDGIPMMFEEIRALSDNQKKEDYGAGLYYFLRQGLYNNIVNKYSCSAEQTAAMTFMNQYYEDKSFLAGSNPENFSSDSEEIKILTNIREYYEVQILQMIMCKPDALEGMYEETMAKLYELGQEKLDVAIDTFYKEKAENALKFGADLDLSYMGL